MRIVVSFLIVCFLVAPAYADRFCKWDGSKAVECRRNSANGFLQYAPKRYVSGVENYSQYGYYPLVLVEATPTGTQTVDSYSWSFDGTTITRTTVLRDKTATEITEETGEVMSLEMYHVLKALATPGAIKNNGALDPSKMPQYLQDAYQARQDLNQ